LIFITVDIFKHTSSCVLCAWCYLWIVYSWLPLVLFVFVLCAWCYLWIVYSWLPLVLFVFVLCAWCYLWIVYSWLPLVLFVFILCLVCPVLPLDYLFLIAPCFVCLRPVSCVPGITSGLSILDCPLFCLSSSCVLCARYYLWIIYSWLPLVLFVFVLCLVCLVLPLDCLFLIAPCFVCLHPVSCVLGVTSGLPLVLFVFVLCLVCLVLPLDCLFLIAPCFVCLRPVSCLPGVTSGLYILDCPLFCLSSSCVLCARCYQCLGIIYPTFIIYIHLDTGN
jgi:hypothetical protein